VRSSWRKGLRGVEVRVGLMEVAEAEGDWVGMDVPGDGDGDGKWLRGRVGVVGAALEGGNLLMGDMPLVDEPVVVEDVGVGICEWLLVLLRRLSRWRRFGMRIGSLTLGAGDVVVLICPFDMF